MCRRCRWSRSGARSRCTARDRTGTSLGLEERAGALLLAELSDPRSPATPRGMLGLDPGFDRDRSFDDERAARRSADHQRDRLRSLFVSAPVAIATWRGQGYTFESANNAYLQMFRRGREIIGKTFAEVFPELPPDDAV